MNHFISQDCELIRAVETLEEEESKEESKKFISDLVIEPKNGGDNRGAVEAEEPKDKASTEDSGSIDDVADADKAREADAPIDEECSVIAPQPFGAESAVGSDKTTGSNETEKSIMKEPLASHEVTKASRGRASSTGPAPDAKWTKLITGKPTASKPSGKPVQASGDTNKKDLGAAEKGIQGKAALSDKAHRDLIAANRRANSQKPPAKTKPAGSPTGSPNRAAIRAALTGKPIVDPAKAAKEDAEEAKRQAEEADLLAEHRRDQKELQQQQRKEELERRKEDADEQRAIRAEKREWDAKRREDARKTIENAANLKATSLQDLEKIRAQNQFVERFSGMTQQTGRYDFDPTAPRGPSQNVTYTSRFVDRLSDVTEDMSVSASLSIKAGKVGGSGKGSFVDSDKFKESDLNFYISVKVINQTINFKDPLCTIRYRTSIRRISAKSMATPSSLASSRVVNSMRLLV